MGTDELFQHHTRQFIRECKDWIALLEKDYLVLENFVLASNQKHISWIKWAGFELVEYLPNFGVQRKPFWRFQRVVRKAATKVVAASRIWRVERSGT